MIFPMYARHYLASALLLIASASWGDAVVQLKDEVFVKGPTVTAGDLIEVKEGDLADRLADVELSPAARPGSSRSFSASLVEARLKNAGVEGLSFTGPSKVRATTMHLDISKEVVAASLHDYIQTEMPWDPAVTEIDIPFPGSDIVAPEGQMEIRWRTNPQYRYIGPAAFRGELLVDGVVCRNLSVRADIESYHEIVVAASDIPRGRPVMADHLELQMVPVSKTPTAAVTDMGAVVGLIAKKTIFPGQPVTSRSVETRRLIRRNQMVPVEVRSGTIHIQHRARAMMDGRAGDLIICANPVTKEEFQGKLRADGVVEVNQ